MTTEPSNPGARHEQDLAPKSYASAADPASESGEVAHAADDWLKLNGDNKSTQHHKKRRHQRHGHHASDDTSDNAEHHVDAQQEQVPRPALNAADLPLEKHRLEKEQAVRSHSPRSKSTDLDAETSEQSSFERDGLAERDGKLDQGVDGPTTRDEDADASSGAADSMQGRESAASNGESAPAAPLALPRTEPEVKAKAAYDADRKPELEVEEDMSEGKHLVSIPGAQDHDAQIALDLKENPGKPMPKVDTRGRSFSELTRGRKPGQGWDDSKMRFAPLNIPLKRRLQTGTVLFHSLTLSIGLSMFFLMCCLPLLWPLAIIYIAYLQYSDAATNGSVNHRLPWLRGSRMFSLFGSYFPARLYRTVELDPTKKYLLGYHPHGIIAHGAFAAFCTDALGAPVLFPGLTFALTTLESNFKIPFYREYALAMGLISVGKRSCINFLTRGGQDGHGMGRAVVIVVGGAAESLDAKERSMKLTLRSRKGFVKLAVQTGAMLCPVLCFGENELYSTITHDTNPEIYRWQVGFKKRFGWTIPIFHARGVFNYSGGLMPYRHPMHVIVGKPIEVVQHHSPDPAYVDELQARYIEELKRIYYEGREVFAADPACELEIL